MRTLEKLRYWLQPILKLNQFIILTIVSDGKYSDTQSVVLNVNDINEWEITDTNDLRWFDVASGVDIILNQSDYPVGPPQFDGDGNFTGYASNDSQSPDVNVIQLSNGNLAAVWSVDVWKELADGSWTDTSVSDVFYRVFNPTDGSFITDEIRLMIMNTLMLFRKLILLGQI